MTLTIELTADSEKALQEEALRRGLSIQEYAKSLLESSLPAYANGAAAARLSLEEQERLLDELAAGNEHLPILPPEANSREWIYRDHD